MPLALILPRGDQCVCVFSSHSFWTSSSLDVPAGVTQEEGHTGFLIHLPSAVRAFIFLARRIQPFLSLVTVKSNFVAISYEEFFSRNVWVRGPKNFLGKKTFINNLIVLHLLGIFFCFSERNSVYRDSNSRPNMSEGYEVTSKLPGRPTLYRMPRRAGSHPIKNAQSNKL